MIEPSWPQYHAARYHILWIDEAKLATSNARLPVGQATEKMEKVSFIVMDKGDCNEVSDFESGDEVEFTVILNDYTVRLRDRTDFYPKTFDDKIIEVSSEDIRLSGSETRSTIPRTTSMFGFLVGSLLNQPGVNDDEDVTFETKEDGG